MTSKKLISLTGIALALAAAAYLSTSRTRVQTPPRIGLPVFDRLDVSRIAAVEIENPADGTVVLRAAESGWQVETLYGYPADIAKIREAVLKLGGLKTGHAADPRRLGPAPTRIRLKDESGDILAQVALGEKRMREPGEATGFIGGAPRADGRYIAVGEEDRVMLVGDSLTAFDGDVKRWIDTQIVSLRTADSVAISVANGDEAVSVSRTNGVWTLAGRDAGETLDATAMHPLESAMSFLTLTAVVDPATPPETTGLSTGIVYTVTLKSGEQYTATIGAVTPGGKDRYFRIEAGFEPNDTDETKNAEIQSRVDAFNARTARWIYTLSDFAANRFITSREKLILKTDAEEEEEPEPLV